MTDAEVLPDRPGHRTARGARRAGRPYRPAAFDPRGGRAAGRHFGPGARSATGLWKSAGGLVFVVAFLLRYIHVQQAYDIFLDEITYSRIAESVAIHHSVAFFGQPFYLHPPALFYEQAFLIDAFRIHGSIFSVVYALRVLNVVFGAGSAVCALRIVTRVGGSVAGFTAAALVALDPFLIRFDGRVFLEPSTLFWVLLGYACLLSAVAAGSGRGRQASLAAAGAAMGVGMLSNEMAVPLVVIPLGCCLLGGWPLRRSEAATPLAVIAAMGVAYLALVTVDGQFHSLASQQLNGLARLIGTDQATGFNKAGSPSLVSRILAHLRGYGGVYAVLGVSLLPLVRYLRRGTPVQRMLCLVAASAYCVLAYQVAFGTLEEQMFYYLDVPAVLVAGLGLGRLLVLGRGRLTTRRRRAGRWVLRLVAAATIAAFLAVDGVAWVQIHTTTDAAMAESITWVDDHVPAGTRIAPLVDTSQLLVNAYQVYTSQTPAAVVADRPAVVLTSSLQVDQGYGFATPALVAWLATHARVAARFSGRTFGTITIWRLAYPEATDAPPGFPDVNAELPAEPVGEGTGPAAHP